MSESSVFKDDLFEGKKVFITGGATGMGLGFAQAFLNHGAKVIIASRKEEKLAEASALTKEKFGKDLLWKTMDVRNNETVEKVSNFIKSEWGELDILVADLPPGTGDVQLTLTQSAPLTSALILTTPSAIALEDVRRGVEMFRQAEVPIFGLVENMSTFQCDACGHNEHLFGHGLTESTAKELDIPFLCDIPLDIKLRECADEGLPAVIDQPSADGSQAITELANDVVAYLEKKSKN